MKRIIKVLLIALVLFSYQSNVFASTVTWKQITDKMKEKENTEIYATITADDTSLTISDEEEEVSFVFTYENGTVSYTAMDKSNLSENEKGIYEFVEYVMIMHMLDTISELYDVDLAEIDEDRLSDYGIEIDVTTEEENDIINSFSIDLDEFEEATKNLVGTYNNNNNNNNNILNVEEPTVSLSLEKANSSSIDLVVNVANLPETSIAECEISILQDNGDSYIVGTIANCQNGSNRYTVTNLTPDTEYTFHVELVEEISQGFTTRTIGENMSFATISNKKRDGNITDNPQTGTIALIITSVSAVISLISFILLYKKTKKQQATN